MGETNVLGVVGDLVEDVVVWFDEPMQEATDTEVSMHRRRGGSGANVAAFAAPICPTRFLGCVGPDAVGDSLVADLAAEGVDVKVQRKGSTGTVVVLIGEDGERTMLPDRGAAVLLDQVDQAWTRDLAHLHLPGYCFATGPLADTAINLVHRMRHQSATVSLDASSTGMLRRYEEQRFLRLVAELEPRLLFANRDEAEHLKLVRGTEPGPPLVALPHTTAIVKDGARPTTVLVPGQDPVRVDVPPVAAVQDLTGAGDAFAAGFLTALLQDGSPEGADLVTACASGHATAARVLAAPGASTSPS